jgi:ArsR family metal-binding transcriptional regulator
MYVERITIEHILPCLADSARIRFKAEIDRDASEMYPYLNTILEGAIYNHEGRTLTIKKEGRLITLHPRQIAAGKVLDEKDAQEIIEWLQGLINHCYDNRGKITPSFERRQRLVALDIFKLLPGTNCRSCGQLTCLAFAVKLGEEQTEVTKCGPLFSGAEPEKRRILLKLLKDSGYRVPPAFSE